MAVPKKRPSKSKRLKKRTHYKLEAVAIAKCNNCGASKRPHRVCPTCGHYKGKQIVSLEF